MMLTDAPIETTESDSFERATFISSMVSSLILPEDSPSVVIGLEGAWGSGKTSCINLARGALEEHESKPIVVDFNPWLISTVENLVEGFFAELASAIGSEKIGNAQETGANVLKFARMLSPIKLIPGVEPWGTLVEKVLCSIGDATVAASGFQDMSLAGSKERLNRSIAGLGRPIVVVIDDIDRLTFEQVRIVFQLIKAVSNFTRVSYLIAYDRSYVAAALTSSEYHSGDSYLEKFVQRVFEIPRLSNRQKEGILRSSLESAVPPFEDREKDAISKMADSCGIYVLLDTPRSIVRVVNRIASLVSALRDEVGPSDIFGFEVLRQEFPALARRIGEEPSMVAWGGNNDFELIGSPSILPELQSERLEQKDESENAANTSRVLRELIELSGLKYRPKRAALRTLLCRLFSNLKGDLAEFVYNKKPSLLRIENRNALLKVLHYGVPGFAASRKEVDAVLMDDVARPKILASWKKEGLLQDFLPSCFDLERFPEALDFDAIFDSVMDLLTGPDEPKELVETIAGFCYSLLNKLSEGDKSQAWLNLLQREFSLSVTEDVLLAHLDRNGMWNRGTYSHEPKKLSDGRNHPLDMALDEILELVDVWLCSVRKAASGEAPSLLSEPELISVLYRWGQLQNGDFAKAREFLDQYGTELSVIDRILEEAPSRTEPKGPEFVSDSLIEHALVVNDDSKHDIAILKGWKQARL